MRLGGGTPRAKKIDRKKTMEKGDRELSAKSGGGKKRLITSMGKKGESSGQLIIGDDRTPEKSQVQGWRRGGRTSPNARREKHGQRNRLYSRFR